MRWSIRSYLAWTVVIACLNVIGGRYWALAVLIASTVPLLFFIVHVRFPDRLRGRLRYSLFLSSMLIPPYVASYGVAVFFMYRYQIEIDDTPWVWRAIEIVEVAYAPVRYLLPECANEAGHAYLGEWMRYSDSYFGLTELVLERDKAIVRSVSGGQE